MRAVSRVPLARRVHSRRRSRRLAIPSRTRGLLAVPPRDRERFFRPRGLASQSRSEGSAPLRDRRRAVGRRRSGPRGIAASARGRSFRCGRGRGAMRAVRRLVSSPPLPGPPLARAASRIVAPALAPPLALGPPLRLPPSRVGGRSSAPPRLVHANERRPGPRTRDTRRGEAGAGEGGARRRRSDAGCGAEAVWAGMRRRRKEPPGRPAPTRVRARSARRLRAHALTPSPRSREARPAQEKPAWPTKEAMLMACCRKYRRPGGGDARVDGIASGRRRRPPTRGRADERRETAARAPRPHGPGIFGCASKILVLPPRAAAAPERPALDTARGVALESRAIRKQPRGRAPRNQGTKP